MPEPISVTPSEITGDFGLIYYEWIEGDPNIYFEGYTCERKDPTAGYTLGNMVYHYVSSAGNDESLRGSVFVMEHGKYIKQDGYLLVEKNDLTDLNLASLKVGYAGRNEFNNGATNGYWMQESHLLTDAFVTGFIYRIRTSAIWSVPVRARFGMFISPVQRSHS
ncbi:MAG: hypothetical protein PUB12_02280 [[Clostridium] aminophilum]|uniref:hypothetical protein n=1 Tax=[Clostridium] aminophilum TaxID=1526 RepID=UPI0026E92EC9|nr:hypothetical protein [[Clostridium] aminophilum]MDD6195708.1 hypothetical protein [[Clostridium] aminophilum]